MSLQEKSTDLNEKLINLCWADENFKNELVADPKGTLEKMGATIADGVEVVVNDQTDTSVVNINIPPRPEAYDVELSEQELEAVSGGSDYFSSWFCNNTVIVNNGDNNSTTTTQERD